jgi:hypothetical protein
MSAPTVVSTNCFSGSGKGVDFQLSHCSPHLSLGNTGLHPNAGAIHPRIVTRQQRTSRLISNVPQEVLLWQRRRAVDPDQVERNSAPLHYWTEGLASADGCGTMLRGAEWGERQRCSPGPGQSRED